MLLNSILMGTQVRLSSSKFIQSENQIKVKYYIIIQWKLTQKSSDSLLDSPLILQVELGGLWSPQKHLQLINRTVCVPRSPQNLLGGSETWGACLVLKIGLRSRGFYHLNSSALWTCYLCLGLHRHLSGLGIVHRGANKNCWVTLVVPWRSRNVRGPGLVLRIELRR